MAGRFLLLAAAARDDAILDQTLGQLFEGTCRELLLPGRTLPRELVEHARLLGGDKHAQVLVSGAFLDFVWRKNSHLVFQAGVVSWSSCRSSSSTSAVTRDVNWGCRACLTASASMMDDTIR